jgi:hypothetical protein
MKKINFIFIILLFIYSLVNVSCSAQKLVYEPIGESDKPLPTIQIITKEDNNLIEKTFIVNKETFRILKKYVSNKLDKKQIPINTGYEYGSYKIIYSNGSKRIEYIIDSRDKSRIFFQGQLELIKINPKLYKEIEVLIKRIS